MLEVHHLKKNYHSKSGVEVKALDDVSLKLPSKGMVFILGKSGSGKSTLLNVLGGLDGFDSGEFYVKGKQINSFRQSDFDSYRNTYVGFIFQEYNIIDDFTVGQNIALAMQLQGKKPNSDDINGILKEVDLDGLGDRKPNELSGGQKQRVAIARALIKKPQIIMADEPTGALDSHTGIQIFDTLKKLSSDKLVLIVSHDREFSERYADRIIEIKDGKIISDVENTVKGKETKEENITCAGDTIIVREDYVLKQSDLKVINDYLKHCKNGGKIKTGTGLKSKSTFKNTNQDNIKMDNSGFTLIRSKLPINYAFKMGMKGLGHKKFKLALTMFLSVISFGMLGMSTSMMFFNNKSATVDTFVNSDINFASIGKVATSGGPYSSYSLKFGDDEFEKAKEAIGTEGQYVISQSYSYTGSDCVYFDQNVYSREYDSVFKRAFNGVSAINSAKDLLDKFGFRSEKSSEGQLGDNGVVISTYIATSIIEKGYCEYSGSGEPIYKPEINSFEKLIGETLYLNLDGNYKTYDIVDIVDTNFKIEDTKYKNIIESNQLYNDPHGNEFMSYANVSLASTVFVNQTNANKYQQYIAEGAKGEGIGNYAVFALPDRASIKKAVDYSFTRYELTSEEKALYPDANISYSQFMLKDQLSQSVNSMAYSLSSMRNIFLYIGLAFIVFSGLLLANFIANSISYQKKEIGILRAIGSRSKDVFKIYYSESIVIAIANFIIASVGAWAIMSFAIVPSFTKMLGGVTLFSFGIIPVLIILGVALLSSFLATFIPVYLTARKKPIEAIRNK